MRILDQRAESVADRLWMVTNADGSHEIVDESRKDGRAGFAPAWKKTYGEVLAEFMGSRDRGEANWLSFYDALKKGVHNIPGVFSGTARGLYFVAKGTAYKAYVGTHHKGRFLGFGGHRFRITIGPDSIESNNVWFIAVVPPHLRDVLSDNAEMRTQEQEQKS